MKLKILKATILLSFLVNDLFAADALLKSDLEFKRPKLIIALVVDQFRADYLMRYKERFLPKNKNGVIGGYRFLMDEGAYFPYAEYGILQSMTGPGHATILSGSYPYNSGIAINDWYNPKNGQKMYCVEDESYQWVGAPTPAHVGTSPRNFSGSTVGDELKNAGYPSKVISIALKDRASILMGGYRSDLSMWFDQNTFQWVSSNFYLPDNKLPEWINKLNSEVAIKPNPIKVWAPRLQETLKTYLNTTSTYPENKTITKIGPVFNHAMSACSPEELASPYGIMLTKEAAIRAIDNYQLGHNKTPDLLAISFSSHDYVGHTFGPNSKEIEDMTVAEDQAISEILNKVQKSVPGGLSDVVVTLTADHGIVPNADWLLANKVEAGRINKQQTIDLIEKHLNEIFGKTENQNWIVYDVDLNFYLNQKILSAKKLEQSKVEDEVKKVLIKVNGIYKVFSKTDVEKRTVPYGMHEKQIYKTYYPGRSGDVVGITKPFFTESDDNVTTHMTGYSYDRTVPLILFGKPFKKGIIPKIVEVVDLAPTLTILTGTVPPSSNEGRVLTEAFKDFK
jgi:predicted AlkP superfamily pyrophosphatase or phosphodiesterase